MNNIISIQKTDHELQLKEEAELNKRISANLLRINIDE